ncbi:MAG: hypothetical protein AB8C46_17845 [Burkholderiaceae bacterium]
MSFRQQLNKALFCAVWFALASSANASDCKLDPVREAGVAEEVRLAAFDGEPTDISLADGQESRSFLAMYYEGSTDKKPFVIAHGPGQTLASHFMTDLALSLSELGYPVLALQMPLVERDCEGAEAYPNTFPNGFKRINAAATWLRSRYDQAPALVGHWIANVYFEQQKNAPFDTWIMTGITGSIGSTGDNFPRILDVYGSEGHQMTLRWAWLRRFWLWLAPGSEQVEIDGADHEFNGQLDEVAVEIDRFLNEAQGE